MTEPTLVSLLQQLVGLDRFALALLVLVGGYRQWWVWGHQLREVKGERDYWRSTALRLAKIAETTVDKAVGP